MHESSFMQVSAFVAHVILHITCADIHMYKKECHPYNSPHSTLNLHFTYHLAN